MVTGCQGKDVALERAINGADFERPPAELGTIVETLTRGTDHENNWSINAPTATEGLRVLFIDRNTNWDSLTSRSAALRGVRNNCRAFPRNKLILCDGSFPLSFLDNYLGNQEHHSAFLLWLVGHELGHMMEGSSGNHSQGDQPIPRRSLESQRIEYAADCWMLRQAVNQASPDKVFEVESLAIDLLNTTFQRNSQDLPAGAGILFDYSRLDPYDFRGTEGHPELPLRAIRLLHIAATEKPDPALAALIGPAVRKLVPDPLWQEKGPCRFDAQVYSKSPPTSD